MPKKEAWLSIQVVRLLHQMWDEKPRNYEFAVAAVRAWVRYLKDEEDAFGETRKRSAARLIKNFIAEARPHCDSGTWKESEHHITLAIGRRLTESSIAEIHRALREH